MLAAGAPAALVLAACGGSESDAEASTESGAAEDPTAGQAPDATAGTAEVADDPQTAEAAAAADGPENSGDTATTPAAAAAAAAPPAAPNITIAFTTTHTKGPQGETIRGALELFAKVEPSIYVEFTAPGDDYAEWLAEVLTGGSAPHLAFGDAVTFHRNRAERLVEIGEPAEKRGWQARAYHFIPDTYTDNDGDMRVPATRRLHGPLFGLPYAISIDGWLINDSLFQAAGAAAPDDAWTWNDVVDAGRQLTDPDRDRWGILATNSPEYFWIPLLYANGVIRPFSEDRLSTGWLADGDAASEALEWATDLIHQWQVAPPLDRVGVVGGAQDPFMSERVAMWPSGSVQATGFLAPRIGDRFNWSLAPSPLAPQTGMRVHAWQGSAHFVTTRAATEGTVEAAVALAQHLAADDTQIAMAVARASVPAKSGAGTVSAAISPPPDNLLMLQTALEDPRTRHLFAFFDTWPAWLDAQATAAAGAFTGEVTPDEALVEMVRGGDAVLSAWWDESQPPNHS